MQQEVVKDVDKIHLQLYLYAYNFTSENGEAEDTTQVQGEKYLVSEENNTGGCSDGEKSEGNAEGSAEKTSQSSSVRDADGIVIDDKDPQTGDGETSETQAEQGSCHSTDNGKETGDGEANGEAQSGENGVQDDLPPPPESVELDNDNNSNNKTIPAVVPPEQEKQLYEFNMLVENAYADPAQ